ncbi:MAG: hypothetical protein K9I84_15590 [Leadbetterella sp.]|nr:hypothetical protein [Leadbetterella sp.]
MRRIHLSANFCCYLTCQLLGFVTICLMNSKIGDKYIAEFIFSFLFSSFFAGNKELIKRYYSE